MAYVVLQKRSFLPRRLLETKRDGKRKTKMRRSRNENELTRHAMPDTLLLQTWPLRRFRAGNVIMATSAQAVLPDACGVSLRLRVVFVSHSV